MSSSNYGHVMLFQRYVDPSTIWTSNYHPTNVMLNPTVWTTIIILQDETVHLWTCNVIQRDVEPSNIGTIIIILQDETVHLWTCNVISTCVESSTIWTL